MTNAAGTASEPGSLTIPIGARPPVISTISFPDMYEGCSGHIRVHASDPHGGNLTYDFQQIAGPQVNQITIFSPYCTFVVPHVNQDERLTFKVGVTNSLNLRAEQTVSSTLIHSGPWTLDLKLNPMPTSVLLDPDRATITLVGQTPNTGAIGVGYGHYRFAGTGDINEDGIEDMVVAGWAAANQTNLPAPVFFLLSNGTGYLFKEGSALGIDNIPGSTLPTIYDFNGDGRKDIFFPGFADVPVKSVPSVLALQQADGKFIKTETAEKIAAHMGDFVDLNRDGRPDLILANYGGPDSIGGLIYYENTNAGLKFRRTDKAPAKIVNLGGSSATAGDYHKTGIPTIINADTSWLVDGTGLTLQNVVEVSNFQWGSNGDLANADQRLFMTPFFNRDPRFTRAFCYWGDWKSHNICMRTMDLDGDGYQDFVMASMIWGGGPSWDYSPQHSIINIVRGTATGFSDETESRLWNYQVTRRESHHCLRVVDLNGDGKPDLIGSDEGQTAPSGANALAPRTTGNEILMNDGAGNLVSVFWEGYDILQQRVLDLTQSLPKALVAYRPERFFPLLGPNRELRWLTFVPYREMDASGAEIQYAAWYLVDAGRLSTGPNLQHPAALGAPGFSELYYLTHNPDVREMVLRGEYASGLEHYLAQGKKEERKIGPQF